MVAAAVLALALFASSAEASTVPEAKPRLIPTSEFATESQITFPVLSPDGTKMLGRVHVGGKEMLGIHSFNGDKLLLIALPEKIDLRYYRWAGNGRVLVSIAKTVVYFGDDAEMTRLLSFEIGKRDFVKLGGKWQGLEGDDVLYVDPSGEYLLLSFQESVFEYPSVFRVELATNKLTEIVKPRSDVWEWYADPAGVVRAGVGGTKHSWAMVYRSTEAEKFRKLGRVKYDDENASYDVLRIARGTDEGYLLSDKGTGRYALYKFNYATKEIGDLVFGSETNDVTDFATDFDGTNLRAVWYTDERDRIVWFDSGMKKIQSDIDTAIKGRENWIVSRNRDDSVMLVWTGASNDPGRYYIYKPAVGVMQRIARMSEALKPAEMPSTKYVKYKARDGLEITAYLTLPLGRSAKSLPLIVLPHGGPYGLRDRPDYDPEVQFLANRGYAVLQPNYRGSGGFGKEFYLKGEGQWGRQMQDDLDDGMDWLVRDGIVDPARVCIVGGSYGGYAALWGATRNPERYRCAASFAGVSDLGRQLKYQLTFRLDPRYRKDWRRIVQGPPEFDTKTVSPLFTVDQLKRPVLLVHGDADQTVPFRQSKLYADALKAAGKPYEFHTLVNEGHGFSSSGNLKRWLDYLETFLTKWNPAN